MGTVDGKLLHDDLNARRTSIINSSNAGGYSRLDQNDDRSLPHALLCSRRPPFPVCESPPGRAIRLYRTPNLPLLRSECGRIEIQTVVM